MDMKLTDDKKTIIITMPIDLKRRGSRRQIIIPEGVKLPFFKPKQDEAMVRALARAFKWQKEIETGKVRSAKELASREKIDSAFMNKTIRLTQLAPDIVEAITEGRQPKSLALSDLMRGFSDEWPQQREALGFPQPKG
ncbi:conserved hypothetical protein [Magnetococcus marinus MC-1]|uniref:Phage-related protein n=1 Tax=Magnetococcus marinus (strain ATCC BAA-1437 / JCM 17883 / MC-1) TaxID=156889 RepID=A0LAX1_MAGMM|nr:hypothetical protein [Magnetococcus marinus]ABK45114.1 conserved hypothetical protein [Magnetococcus marinus MC-1]